MMIPLVLRRCLVLSASMIALGAQAAAQQSVLLVEAAGSVGRYLGPHALNQLVSIEGQNGTPQPSVWEFQVLDPAASTGVQVVQARVSKAWKRADAAIGYPYPDSIPSGFFTWNDLKVDNLAAFQAADKEARLAMIGFDSVHYLLKARDGSGQPVWHLTLIDHAGRPVGRLEISATTGTVERRIWLRYEGPESRKLLRIEDSLSPIATMRPAPPVQLAPPPGLPQESTQPLPNAVTPGAASTLVPASSLAPVPVPPATTTPPPAPASGAAGYEPLPPQ